jgi:hypothetical protein
MINVNLNADGSKLEQGTYLQVLDNVELKNS